MERCWTWLTASDRGCASWGPCNGVKGVVAWYKELPSSRKEKGLFVLSSTLGTILFFFLFESFMIIGMYPHTPHNSLCTHPHSHSSHVVYPSHSFLSFAALLMCRWVRGCVMGFVCAGMTWKLVRVRLL